jgi:hypothetical protein
MVRPLESSIIRIYSISKPDRVIGAGFLVSQKHVLTCAHVVVSAHKLGIKREIADITDAEVYLDFPILGSQRLKAKVVFWQPVNNPNAESEDIALLELESSPPDAASCVRLVKSENLWGHPFRALGFPEGQANGAFASGVLRKPIGNGWVQLENVIQQGYALEHGFSGTAVWDEELQGVVGMAVAMEIKPEVRAAFIIPTDQLVKALPDLNPLVIDAEIWRRGRTQVNDTVEPKPGTKNLNELPATNCNYGFIFDSVNYKELSDGSRVYSLDVFNKRHADGVLESRSQKGELIDIRGIDGRKITPSVLGFGIEAIPKLWQLASEGYDFLDPRNSLGNSRKTQIRNIRVAPGGTLKLRQSGENSMIYNQATFLTRLFVEVPNQSVILAVCEGLQKKGKGNFIKSEIFRSRMNKDMGIPIEEVSNLWSASWVDNQKLEELKNLCQEVLRQQNVNYSKFNENTLGSLLRITGLEMLSFPVTATEDFIKNTNKILQWLDWERAQIIEEREGSLLIHS